MMMRAYFLISVILSYRLDRYSFFKYFRMGLYFLWPQAFFSTKYRSSYFLKEGLEKMGPVFIKLGQLLSTREDLFSKEILDQLKQLQNQVSLDADKEYYLKKHRLLIEQHHDICIESTPCAAASIAQVYKAKKGEKILAVKIQRPQVQAIIQQDLKLLYLLCCFAYFFLPKRLRIFEVYAKIQSILLEELNFLRECAQGDALYEIFYAHPKISIPKIYWDYSSKDTIVMDFAQGQPLSAFLESKKIADKRKKQISFLLLETFIESVFYHGLFHADLHPGNIFFNLSTEKLELVDFGVVSRLDEKEQAFVAAQILAILDKNYEKLGQNFLGFSWTQYPLSLDQQEKFIWDLHILLAPLLQRPLEKISIAQVLIEMITLARRYQIRIQPRLLLLQKTILSLEGLLRRLSPELCIIQEAAEPIIKIIYKKYGRIPSFIRDLIEVDPLSSYQSKNQIF